MLHPQLICTLQQPTQFYQAATMQFVQKSPVFLPKPDTGSQYEYWALDLNNTRPPWREIEATSAMIQNSANQLQEAGPKSVVQCAAIYVDAHNILFVAKTKKKQSVSNAKSGIGNLLGKIDNNYQQLVQSKLHPLDEYDRFHIQQWQTVEVIREEWEECFTDSDQPLALMDSNHSLALMSEVADDDFANMRDVKQNLKFFCNTTWHFAAHFSGRVARSAILHGLHPRSSPDIVACRKITSILSGKTWHAGGCPRGNGTAQRRTPASSKQTFKTCVLGKV